MNTTKSSIQLQSTAPIATMGGTSHKYTVNHDPLRHSQQDHGQAHLAQ